MMNDFAHRFGSFITVDAANIDFDHSLAHIAKLPSAQRPPTILRVEEIEPDRGSCGREAVNGANA
jgi:hypothetical protein